MFRYIALIITAAIVYFLVRQILSQVHFKFNKCEYCDGKGYWLGTRGDKNHCKVCDGTGKA